MTDGDVPVGRPAEDEAADANGENGEINTTEEGIALTASQEALGMKINQPDSNIRDSTARLHAVPSEKLRAWTGWLSKVGERADEWHWWLRSQIRFTAEMNELLRGAAAALREERSGGQNSRHSDTAASRTADVGEEIEAAGRVAEERREAARSKTGSQRRADKVAETVGQKVAGRRDEESSSKDGEEGSAGSEKSEEARVNYKEGFWPIGTRWEPTSRTSQQGSSPSLSLKREPDKVRMPADEPTMRDLIERIVRQGVVYRKLYRHWSETGDQAVKEIVGRTVMPTNRVYSNGEELPYCFYVEANSPDTNEVVEQDDDGSAVLLADEGRERISREFNYLYFNLSDKPARGG